jgi:hypothetical protein
MLGHHLVDDNLVLVLLVEIYNLGTLFISAAIPSSLTVLIRGSKGGFGLN